ncbi:ATP-dependent Clp protease ATP-binding subunit ClpA [Thorsellia kenyensis]|uniref:ATP-dependent Clp protease ATP-binding subunit ClpA n=1 Tax=Thorsellia kenyensis TaxID=1549888 RepID=A0ABV6CD65_9GAMM
MLNKALELTLNEAFAKAQEWNHEFVTVEHLLLALLENPDAHPALEACKLNFAYMREDLTSFILQTTPTIKPDDESHELQPTLSFQRVIQRAVFHVQSSGNKEVTGADVVIALFSEQESHAVYLLKKYELSRLDIVNYIAHGMSKSENTPSENTEEQSSINPEDKMDNYCVNLNESARQGTIDPLIGRTEELSRTIQVLCRRRKNNPLLVGESGVGKTAIAEGLALAIIKGNVPDIIKNAVIYSLDIGALLAGTKFRGDFEKRFKALIKQLTDETNSILFIDEIHTIIGAGASSGGQVDVANLLKPALSSGKIRVMGSTTYKEFSSIFEKEQALTRRFQKIDILEPSKEDALKILKGLKTKYELHHEVKYSPQSLQAAVDLSIKYLNDRHLPDKAIDLIDEAGAKNRLLAAKSRKKTLGVAEMESVVALLARIPEKTVSSDDKSLLQALPDRLKMLVFGQDDAINVLTDAILMNRSGLGFENKPVGSFLFAGPTGVGKTEVTVQLAKGLNVELLRFDMSEYMEKHAVSRLIGAPPGYVGYEQGGLLTDAVIKHPYCVVLLDEIEKAHPDVYNILLQVMDNGTLTDNNGRKADFRNVILVMTTNAGVRETEKSSIGLIHQKSPSDGLEEIKKVFTPEFRNRLDNVIWFNHLSTDIISQVVDKFIVELQAQLDTKSISLEVDVKARAWLAEKGYDKSMGARPMARMVQEYLKKPLSKEILFGKLQKGGGVKVTTNKEKSNLSFSFEKLNPSHFSMEDTLENLDS